MASFQTAKHDGLYPLLSISLTVPPFVEHFQQRDDPCRIGFYALALAMQYIYMYITREILENVEHCGGEPEQADTGYYVTDE